MQSKPSTNDLSLQFLSAAAGKRQLPAFMTKQEFRKKLYVI
jgi:hypothetical protein